MPEHRQPDRLREDPGLDARRATYVGGGLAVVIVLVALMSYAIWHAFGQPHAAVPTEDGPSRLQPAPQPARERYQLEKQRLIDSYAWVDREHNIARIPVDEAMRMLAAQPRKDGS